MGSPFGKAGYSEKNQTMRDASQALRDQSGNVNYSPGSSGYSINNSYGVNPDTGRSFTTLQNSKDYIGGDINSVFSGMANAQGDALKRGQSGAMRSAVSSFGRSGLGAGGLGKMLAAQGAQTSRGLADIQRNNLMDKLGYGTDMYKFERGQGLQDELGLRGARATDAAGRRADVTSQYGMDQGKSQDAYNRALQTYAGLSGNKSQGTQGWAGTAAKLGGTFVGAALGNPNAGGAKTGGLGTMGGAAQQPQGFGNNMSWLYGK